MPERLVLKEHWENLHDCSQHIRAIIAEIRKEIEEHGEPRNELAEALCSEHEKLTNAIQLAKANSPFLSEMLEHDFGNYLTPLKMTCDSLKVKKRVGIKLLKRNAPIFDIVHYVIGAIRFYVDGKLETKEINLGEFLDKGKRIFEKSFGFQKIKMIIKVEDLVIEAHEETLGNLIQNICSNAYKRGHATQLIIMVENGDSLKIIISDNGKGIDTSANENEVETINKIFERGGSFSGGKGLGLANAKEKMQAMGGDIICVPHGGIVHPGTETKGACFVLTVPLKKTQMSNAAAGGVDNEKEVKEMEPEPSQPNV